jgi:serine protease Do
VVYNADADTAATDGISEDIKLYLYGQEYADYAISAEYVGGSMNYDIAVLRVTGSEVLMQSNAMAATFSDSNNISILETAIAIGNPEASGISATVGSVNVDSEYLTMSAISGNGNTTLRVMRIDAAVNRGNSGGGLFNDKGELIGIVNAKMSSSNVDNIGYAIPSNVAKNVADNIIYYDGIDKSNDSVFRIMIGINVGIVEAYTEYDTDTGKIYKRERVNVSDVVSGSAVKDVLKRGDVIEAIIIDGERHEVIRTFNVVDAMLNARSDSSVVFEIVRDGEKMTVSIDVSKIQPQAY